MNKPPKRYAADFRREAAELLLTGGKPLKVLAVELGTVMSPGTPGATGIWPKFGGIKMGVFVNGCKNPIIFLLSIRASLRLL